VAAACEPLSLFTRAPAWAYVASKSPAVWMARRGRFPVRLNEGRMPGTMACVALPLEYARPVLSEPEIGHQISRRPPIAGRALCARRSSEVQKKARKERRAGRKLQPTMGRLALANRIARQR
jgi:hypothetical protein